MRGYLCRLGLLCLVILAVPLLMAQVPRGVVVHGVSTGGTGITSYSVGDLLYADTTSSLAKLTDVPVGYVLASGGNNTAPAWSNIPQINGFTLSTGTQTVTSNAADTISVRRGVNGQLIKIFNSYTDESTNDFGSIGWNSNAFKILTGNTGGATSRALQIGTIDSANVQFIHNNVSAWAINGATHNFVANTDNSWDIGGSSSTLRPRTIYAGTSVVAPLINATGTGYQVGGLPLYQGCSVVIGADNGSALADADLGPQGRQCLVRNAGTVTEITVSGDAGTPNVIVRRNRAGTTANFVSSALATASAGGLACSKVGATTGLDGTTTCAATLQNTSLNAGDWIELGSGTAGGVAKRMSISLTYSVP